MRSPTDTASLPFSMAKAGVDGLCRFTVDDLDAIEPGLLLFAAFIVRGRAEDAQSAAGAGASTASGAG